MKYLLSAFLVLCVACVQPPVGTSTVQDKSNEIVTYTNTTIEGCEYLVTTVHGGKTLTHKGNCKNPVHQCHVFADEIKKK